MAGEVRRRGESAEIGDGGVKIDELDEAAGDVVIGPHRLGLAVGRAVQFIGTGVWDTPSIGNESMLRGAWYAAPDPARRADFERKFASTYGRPPHRLYLKESPADQRQPPGLLGGYCLRHHAGEYALRLDATEPAHGTNNPLGFLLWPDASRT